MKSLKINLRLVLISLISALTFSSMFSSQLRKQSKVTNNQADSSKTNTTYINPTIDNTRKIRGNEPLYEKVSYVSQLSAGGKAALEIQESGEYILLKLVLNIRSS